MICVHGAGDGRLGQRGFDSGEAYPPFYHQRAFVTSAYTRGQSALEFFLVELDRTVNRRNSICTRFETMDKDLNGLFLELLVVLEKMLHFFEHVRIDVSEIIDVVEADIFYRHRNHFVVGLRVIGHFHEPDGAHRHQYARWDRIGRQQNHIERIAVVPECLWCKAVFERIRGGGKIHSVELDEAGLFVDLVLIVRAFRDLDDDIEFLGRIFAEWYVVPEVHGERFSVNVEALQRERHH